MIACKQYSTVLRVHQSIHSSSREAEKQAGPSLAGRNGVSDMDVTATLIYDKISLRFERTSSAKLHLCLFPTLPIQI